MKIKEFSEQEEKNTFENKLNKMEKRIKKWVELLNKEYINFYNIKFWKVHNDNINYLCIFLSWNSISDSNDKSIEIYDIF
jgi:hypothetical protein